MTNVPILGAGGSIARVAITLPLRATDVRLTWHPRDARRSRSRDPARVCVVEGDVLDTATPESAMAGQDVVHANLAGDLVVRLTRQPRLEVRRSLGVSRPR